MLVGICGSTSFAYALYFVQGSKQNAMANLASQASARARRR